VLARGKFVYDADGRAEKLYAACVDISEIKSVQDKLEKTVEDMQRQNEQITNFFINMSHEFRTPLSVMLIALELFEHQIAEAQMDELCESAKIIRGNVYRMRRLVNNLLDVSKIDAGYMQPRLAAVDIAELLYSLVDSIRIYADQKGIALAFAPCERRVVVTDTEYVERMVLNLLSNAIKHTGPGGRIDVRLKDLGLRIVISVKDTGAGIAKEKQAIVFDRFVQADASLSRGHEGCGIGLALTKALAENLGGRIWLKSTPGKGSEFFIALPTTGDAAAAPRAMPDKLMREERIRIELSDIDFQ
jgi:signal transduction histidine kinase